MGIPRRNGSFRLSGPGKGGVIPRSRTRMCSGLCGFKRHLCVLASTKYLVSRATASDLGGIKPRKIRERQTLGGGNGRD